MLYVTVWSHTQVASIEFHSPNEIHAAKYSTKKKGFWHKTVWLTTTSYRHPLKLEYSLNPPFPATLATRLSAPPLVCLLLCSDLCSQLSNCEQLNIPDHKLMVLCFECVVLFCFMLEWMGLILNIYNIKKKTMASLIRCKSAVQHKYVFGRE